MNVTGRQACRAGALIILAPLATRGICESNLAVGGFLPCVLDAAAKGRRSGKDWRGLARSLPRALHKISNQILVEGLNGARLFDKGRPICALGVA